MPAGQVLQAKEPSAVYDPAGQAAKTVTGRVPFAMSGPTTTEIIRCPAVALVPTSRTIFAPGTHPASSQDDVAGVQSVSV